MEENQLEKVPLNKMGHFYSDKVHVVNYIYQKQSSLYTRMEGMVYVWIGTKVKANREDIVKRVLEEMPSVGGLPNMVCD